MSQIDEAIDALIDACKKCKQTIEEWLEQKKPSWQDQDAEDHSQFDYE